MVLFNKHLYQTANTTARSNLHSGAMKQASKDPERIKKRAAEPKFCDPKTNPLSCLLTDDVRTRRRLRVHQR